MGSLTENKQATKLNFILCIAIETQNMYEGPYYLNSEQDLSAEGQMETQTAGTCVQARICMKEQGTEP